MCVCVCVCVCLCVSLLLFLNTYGGGCNTGGGVHVKV